MKTELKSYRAEARDKAIAAMEGGSSGFLLINEQRTGKTQISLAVAEHFRKNAPWLLIVCPKGAIKVWQDALKQEYLRGTFAEVLITNYEQIRVNRLEWYKWGDKHKDRFIFIGDEIHRIKDRGSGVSGSMRTLSKRAAYKLGLTGTPIEQSLEDAWPLFDFIDPRIFGRFDNTLDKDKKTIIELGFEGKYLIRGGFRNKKVVGYQNEEEYKRIFHKHSYRITLDEAKRRDGKIPPITHYRKSYFELSSRTRRIYEEIKEELETIVNVKDRKRIKIKNVLAACTKLQQVTGGFFRETWYEEKKTPEGIRQIKCYKDHPIGTEKLEQFHQELRSMQAGTKFLVICRHIYEIETVHSWLFHQGYRVQVIRGGLPYSGKISGDGAIMQIASAIAVDLSAADTIFFYSTDYSSIKFEQASFRILSYEKGRSSKYVFLLAKGTVDELIFKSLSTKKRFVDIVVDEYRHERGKNG